MTMIYHHIAAHVAMMRSTVSPDYTKFALIPWEAFMSTKSVTYTDNELLRHQWEHDYNDNYAWYFYFRLPPDALPYTMIRVLGNHVLFSEPPQSDPTRITDWTSPYGQAIITAIQQGQAGPPIGSSPIVQNWRP